MSRRGARDPATRGSPRPTAQDIGGRQAARVGFEPISDDPLAVADGSATVAGRVEVDTVDLDSSVPAQPVELGLERGQVK